MANSETALLPLIDTHQHLWDLNLFRLPWVGTEGPLARSFVMADYLREVEGQNVVGTVYMEVDVDPEQQNEEADYVTGLCQRDDNPMRGAVISGRPDSPDFEIYVRRFTTPPYHPPIRGLRQVLHGGTPPGHCLKPEFLAGIRLLGDLGLTFDICIRPEELGDAARLADACPQTQFILDHCGNANVQWERESPPVRQWREGITEVARHSNVACKISGIIASSNPQSWTPDDLAPYIHHCAEAFGPEDIVFGGDWPVCTLGAPLREWITALRYIVRGWSEAEQQKLFHDNALRIYGLRTELDSSSGYS